MAYSFRGEIRIWDSDTGKVSKIADGDAPAWSPSGEWIAYLQGTWDPLTNRIVFEPGRWAPRCIAVRPDGSGKKTLIELRHTKNSSRVLVEPPVWSPDSRSILLNELADVDRNTVSIHLLDLQTLKLKTIFRNTIHVAGWAAAE